MSTKGEVYAGLRSNNPEPAEITQIRGVIATVIDNLDSMDSSSPNTKRLVALAQTKLEEACMFAVKAVYSAIEPEDFIVPTAHDPAIDA